MSKTKKYMTIRTIISCAVLCISIVVFFFLLPKISIVSDTSGFKFLSLALLFGSRIITSFIQNRIAVSRGDDPPYKTLKEMV